jgi:two-component system, LytTR family, response regulator
MEITSSRSGKKLEEGIRVAIPTFEGYEVLSTKEIIRCEGAGNYTKIIYDQPKKELLVSRKLRDFEGLLDGTGFIRVHNSHIINPNHIIRYFKRDGGLFEMSDGQMIRITREKAKVMDIFFEDVRKL